MGAVVCCGRSFVVEVEYCRYVWDMTPGDSMVVLVDCQLHASPPMLPMVKDSKFMYRTLHCNMDFV